ncbi:MAG: shikimate dehydrogenase [Solirubrobacterales bacterium]|nr:shikimate dehydrogenase [Solirubrobacterales bacterium]
MPLTGVAGWPVAHSRSPQLHAAAFADLGLEGWESQLLPIPVEVFAETVRALPASGFVGINVTIPHKEAAFEVADESSETSRATGAANTLTFKDGRIFADNTDSPAIGAAIADALGMSDLSGLTVGVLGAGGSDRAAAHAAVAGGAAQTRVWNRNSVRSELLASELDGVEAVAELGDLDVLINATPVGLLAGSSLSDLPNQGRAPDGCRLVLDLVYADQPTELIKLATAMGVPSVNGLEILVRQGALSVEIWCGQRPDLGALRTAVAVP